MEIEIRRIAMVIRRQFAIDAVAAYLPLHFIHERGKGPNPTPVLLIHGFPDSFYRYHKVIERLTDPAKSGRISAIVPQRDGPDVQDQRRQAGNSLCKKDRGAAVADQLTRLRLLCVMLSAKPLARPRFRTLSGASKRNS